MENKLVKKIKIIFLEKFWIAEMIILAAILITVLGKNINQIYTLWEMGDEGGYLFNASLFSPNDWRETFSNSKSYYGFGYSMLLIPLFYLCKTGLNLIRGCIVVNILCILGIYFIQIYMLKKMCNNIKNVILPLLSFSVCLYPYLIGNTFKVTCEVFLTLQYWIIILLIYKALKGNRYWNYIILAISNVFIFFIHTRAFVITFSTIFLFAILFVRKRVEFKKILCLLVFSFVAFICLYTIKNMILDILGTGRIIENENSVIANTITSSFILERIKWLFDKENILKYIITAITKIFYITVATLGMFFWGVLYIIREIKYGIKTLLDDNVKIIKIFCLLSFILMWLACCVVGTGNSYNYMIYGRYYEFCIAPLVLMGAYYVLYNKNIRNTFIITLIMVFMGILAQNLSKYVESDQIFIDTSRYVGISHAIKNNINYTNVICWLTIYTVLCNILFIICKKNDKSKNIIIFILIINLLINDKVVLDEIFKVNKNCISDMMLTDEILSDQKKTNIYFVYEPYRYGTFYQRIQVFIKNDPMHIIYPEEIEELAENVALITYVDSETSQELKNNNKWKYVMSSTHYELFERELE